MYIEESILESVRCGKFYTGECLLEIVYWRMYTGEVYAGECIMEDV